MLRGRCFFFKRNKKGQQQAARLMHSPAGLGSGLSAALQTCLSLIVIWRVWTSLGNHTESPECTLVYKIWRSHPKRTFSQLNLKVSGTLSGFRFWGYRHPLSLTTQNPQNVHLCTKSGKSSQTDVFVIEFDGFWCAVRIQTLRVWASSPPHYHIESSAGLGTSPRAIRHRRVLLFNKASGQHSTCTRLEAPCASL